MQDPLAISLDELSRQTLGPAEPVLPVTLGYLSQAESFFLELEVVQDQCYTIVAIAESTLSDLDLHVYATSVEVASDTQLDAAPIVNWCSTTNDRLSVEVRAYEGSGRFALQAFSQNPPPAATSGNVWAALTFMTAEYAGGFFPASPPFGGVLGTGQQGDHEVLLAGGREYVIVATGAATVNDLDLTLRGGEDTDSEAIVAEDISGDRDAVARFVLPPEAGATYRLSVTIASGYGEYAFQIMAR